MGPFRFDRSYDMLAHARRVVAGGVHAAAGPFLGGGACPVFLERGSGGRSWDVGRAVALPLEAQGDFLPRLLAAETLGRFSLV
jgi:hypothetical protein